MLGACAVVGAGIGASVDAWQRQPAIGAVIGALYVLLLVHVYGVGLWLSIRLIRRGRARSYARAAYSPFVLGVVLLGTLAFGGPRALQERRADPVGKKLAGTSREISDADRDHLRARWPAGVQLSVSTTRVLSDYRSRWLPRAAWLESSRPRLEQASGALIELRRHTRALDDPQMRRTLDRWDEAGAAVVAALKRLEAAVATHGAAARADAERLAAGRMAAFVGVSDRLQSLVRPYLTPQQRDAQAATAAIIRGGG